MHLKKFFSFFILLFSLIIFPLDIYGQEEFLGEIIYVDENKIVINNRFFKLNQNVDVIYKNQLGTQLISAEDIPLGVFGVAYLEDMTIKALEVSGRDYNTEKIIIKEILKIPEYIDKFHLSYDEKYLAYYSQEESQLIVKELATENIIWQKEVPISPAFSFNPQACEIIFTFIDEDFYGLASYNLLNNCEKFLIREPISNNEFINYFEIAPNGECIVFTTLSGLTDSQGYVSNIHLIDKKGYTLLVLNISNVYFISWSPDSSALAFSKYEEPNLETSQIGYYHLETNNCVLLEKEKHINQFNPAFYKDSNKLIFTHSENFIDKTVLYDLTSHQKVELFKDYNYISNFCWLDDKTLIYTYGDLPQIKIINLETKNTLKISEGYYPQVRNNILYFLKNDLTGNTYLYSYKTK